MSQSTPPPYVGITGLYVEDPKHVDTDLAGFDGNASPGQLVVDTATYDLYVGNALGNLNLVGGGGGNTTWATLGDKNNASGPTAIALGQNAGVSQGTQTVAIGATAGNSTQGNQAVAIGSAAGSTTQGNNAIAIGRQAGFQDQGLQTVAIGTFAGASTQGNNSVAIGRSAGVTSQGANSIAIGNSAGQTNQGLNSIAIGPEAGLSNQANNSIILNASGGSLGQTTANTFTVKPVRSVTSVTFAAPTAGSIPAGFSPMYYNPTTGEIIVITP
jgi:hypothetical protein